MQKVFPYKSLSGALKALDNGGRFYHFFVERGDRVVTAAELKKAAGVFSDDQAACLFYEMATAGLDDAARAEVDGALGSHAQEIRRWHKPAWVAPADFAKTARPGKAFVVEGEVERVDDEDVQGMAFVPVMVGNVTSLIPVPITHKYSLYTLMPSGKRMPCQVLTPKQAVDLSGRCRFGGIAKEGEVGEGTRKRKVLRLEARFYTRPID